MSVLAVEVTAILGLLSLAAAGPVEDVPAPVPAPMSYHGGPVARDPSVHLIWWGPSWKTDPLGVRIQVTSYWATVSGTPETTLMTHYYDRRGHIHNDVRLGGSWIDAVVPPPRITGAEVDAEVLRAIAINHWPTGPDNQYQVLPEGGHSYPHMDSCGGHGVTHIGGRPVVVALVPDLLDLRPQCFGPHDPPNSISDREVGVSTHEAYEAMADPLLNGWYGALGEPADACTSEPGALEPVLWDPRMRRCEPGARHDMTLHATVRPDPRAPAGEAEMSIAVDDASFAVATEYELSIQAMPPGGWDSIGGRHLPVPTFDAQPGPCHDVGPDPVRPFAVLFDCRPRSGTFTLVGTLRVPVTLSTSGIIDVTAVRPSPQEPIGSEALQNPVLEVGSAARWWSTLPRFLDPVLNPAVIPSRSVG